MSSTKILRFPAPARNRRGNDMAREISALRDELRLVRASLQRVLRALPPAPFGPFEEEKNG